MSSQNYKHSFLFFFMVGVISSFLYIKTYPLQINIKPKALQIEPEYFQKITKNWLGQSHSKAEAQWSHHLWTTAPDESTPRLSLNFLENPDLFSIIFPGYPPEMRIDNDLWTIYFNRNFDQKIQLKKISDFSKHVLLVPLPWLGCLDIYQKYGADILILGASDAAQGIMVDLLAEKLNPKFSNARVLTCSTPGATTEVVLSFVEILKTLKPPRKIKWAIVGLSPSGFLTTFPFAKSLKYIKQDTLLDFKKKKSLGPFEIVNQGFSLPINWNNIIPVRRSAEHLPVETASNSISLNNVIPERWSIHPSSFSAEMISDEKKVHEFLAKNPFNHIFIDENLVKNECLPVGHNEYVIYRIKEELKNISEKILLFQMPTIGYELYNVPNCFLPDVKNAFLQNSDAQTLTLVKNFDDFGLKISDYTIEDQKNRRLFKIDLVHLNKFGANKVTNMIAAEILNN